MASCRLFLDSIFLLASLLQMVGARLEMSGLAGRGTHPLRLRGGMPVFFSQNFGGGGGGFP
eukprot:CAMPEP_0196722802 /NCGR_PEP_ID=MMETSP1091-20130531/5054_1 /TAXON_ID=302021 /ORGANISM="Rhodomonas sp., Strain CCMP768" /LENGTH=60 /DNA_ID=CAMNT_0042064581 /DNA_START=194 /DNA_END=373 /DNA_ORIENTATION=+